VRSKSLERWVDHRQDVNVADGKLQALLQIAEVIAKTDKAQAGAIYAEVLELVPHYFGSYQQATWLLDAAVSMAKNGQAQRAAEVLDQCLRIAGLLDDSDEKGRLLTRIAGALSDIGQEHRSLAVFSQAAQVASSLYGNTTAMGEVVVELARSGHPDRAFDLLNKIEISNRLRASLEVGSLLKEKGDAKRAAAAYDQALVAAKVDQDSFALARLALALAEDGRYASAAFACRKTLEVLQKGEMDPYCKAYAMEGGPEHLTHLVLFVRNTDGREVAVREFSREQREFARMVMITRLSIERYYRLSEKRSQRPEQPARQ